MRVPGDVDGKRGSALSGPDKCLAARRVLSEWTARVGYAAQVISGRHLTPVEAKRDRRPASSGIQGRWLMNAGGVLVIEQSEWLHPTKGTADVTLVGNDQLNVQYPQQTHVKCSYRVTVLEGGKALELIPTINLQPDEYCPAGRLTALH